MSKSKKIIIAVICAVVVIAVAVAVAIFAGNNNDEYTPENPSTTETQKPITIADAMKQLDSSKYAIQMIDGKAVIVVLGADGKAIINDKNQIQIVVLDENNNIVYDKNGNPQTTWLDMKTPYVGVDGIVTPEFKISIPTGWQSHLSGKLVKTDTPKTNMIMCTLIQHENYDDMSLAEFLKTHGENQKKSHANYDRLGFKVQFEQKNITFSDAKIPAVYCKEVIHNKNGGLTNYSEVIYFEMDGNKKYRFELVSADDESLKALGDFNFVDYANKNFKLV